MALLKVFCDMRGRSVRPSGSLKAESLKRFAQGYSRVHTLRYGATLLAAGLTIMLDDPPPAADQAHPGGILNDRQTPEEYPPGDQAAFRPNRTSPPRRSTGID